MKDAKKLFLDYIDAEAEELESLFAEDARFEVPYLSDIGVVAEFRGRDDIVQHMVYFRTRIFPHSKFANVRLHIVTPDAVFGEYEISGKSEISGKFIHQHFFTLLVAENGKIKLLRAAVNVIASAETHFLNGLAEAIAY